MRGRARVQACDTVPLARRTAATDPLPHETQRDSLAPTGERASMALTWSSVHACGSLSDSSAMRDGKMVSEWDV